MKSAPGSQDTVYADIDMQSYLLRLTKQNQVVVNRYYMVGCEVLPSAITAWFNNQPYHSAPVALNLVHNALVMSMLGNDSSIHVTNHPFEYSPEVRAEQIKLLGSLGYMLGVNISFAMSIVTAFYVLSVVRVGDWFPNPHIVISINILFLRAGTSKSIEISSVSQRCKCLHLLGNLLFVGLHGPSYVRMYNDHCTRCLWRRRLELSK